MDAAVHPVSVHVPVDLLQLLQQLALSRMSTPLLSNGAPVSPAMQNAMSHLHVRRCDVARQAAHELRCIQLEFAELLQRAEGPPHHSRTTQTDAARTYHANSFSAAAASFERSSGTNSGLQQPLRDLTIPRNELRSASVGPISPPAASPLGPSPVWAQQPSELQPSAHPPAGAPHRQPALLQSTPLVTPPSRPQSLLHLQQSPPAADASTGEAAAERDAQKTVSRSAGEDNGHLEPAVLASQSNDPSSEPAASTVEAVIASAADDGAQGIGAGAGAEVEAEAAASFDGEGSTSDATPPHTPDPDAASRPSSAAPVQAIAVESSVAASPAWPRLPLGAGAAPSEAATSAGAVAAASPPLLPAPSLASASSFGPASSAASAATSAGRAAADFASKQLRRPGQTNRTASGGLSNSVVPRKAASQQQPLQQLRPSTGPALQRLSTGTPPQQQRPPTDTTTPQRPTTGPTPQQQRPSTGITPQQRSAPRATPEQQRPPTGRQAPLRAPMWNGSTQLAPRSRPPAPRPTVDTDGFTSVSRSRRQSTASYPSSSSSPASGSSASGSHASGSDTPNGAAGSRTPGSAAKAAASKAQSDARPRTADKGVEARLVAPPATQASSAGDSPSASAALDDIVDGVSVVAEEGSTPAMMAPDKGVGAGDSEGLGTGASVAEVPSSGPGTPRRGADSAATAALRRTNSSAGTSHEDASEFAATSFVASAVHSAVHGGQATQHDIFAAQSQVGTSSGRESSGRPAAEAADVSDRASSTGTAQRVPAAGSNQGAEAPGSDTAEAVVIGVNGAADAEADGNSMPRAASSADISGTPSEAASVAGDVAVMASGESKAEQQRRKRREKAERQRRAKQEKTAKEAAEDALLSQAAAEAQQEQARKQAAFEAKAQQLLRQEASNIAARNALTHAKAATMRARPVARHPTSLVRNMAPRTNSGSAAGGSSGDGKEAGETVFTNPMLGGYTASSSTTNNPSKPFAPGTGSPVSQGIRSGVDSATSPSAPSSGEKGIPPQEGEAPKKLFTLNGSHRQHSGAQFGFNFEIQPST